MNDLPVPQRNTRTWWIRIPPEHRAYLHFHLEAGDGWAYLETGPGPAVGRLDVAPGNEAALASWLAAAAPELGGAAVIGQGADPPSGYDREGAGP